MSIPLLEFDPNERAVIEPCDVVPALDVPEHCVLCFFQEVLEGLAQSGKASVLCHQYSSMGAHPVYETEFDGQRVALFMPGLGASFAAAFLEEVIARGCRKFIVCGSSGVLSSDIPRDQLVIPTAAVRDEGVSYHYAPPSREIAPTERALAALQETLGSKGIEYLSGKTWTTDAFFRETPAKVRRRREEGCVTVEMEGAALFAVARFRKVELALLLYGGDDVSQDVWDARRCDSTASCRENMLWLAVEACLAT